jgi:hypothetical protein
MKVGGKMVYASGREAGGDAGLYARTPLLRATFATHLAEADEGGDSRIARQSH